MLELTSKELIIMAHHFSCEINCVDLCDRENLLPRYGRTIGLCDKGR